MSKFVVILGNEEFYPSICEITETNHIIGVCNLVDGQLKWNIVEKSSIYEDDNILDNYSKSFDSLDAALKFIT